MPVTLWNRTLFNLRNTFDDNERSASVSEADKKELTDLIDKALDWMDQYPDVKKDELDAKQKDLEQNCQPHDACVVFRWSEQRTWETLATIICDRRAMARNLCVESSET